jgi:hypothetical protein
MLFGYDVVWNFAICVLSQPTEEERKKILRAIASGDRIGATSMYISRTECGLTEAQAFIKALTAELQAESPERFVQKPRRHRL